MTTKKIFGIELISPITGSPLFETDNYLVSTMHEKFPIIHRIPRFVPEENYASAFGFQWNTFKETQLDSYSGLSISRDRLKRIAGGSLDVFTDKKVLEAGCGAGRFTEIMLKSGAWVFAADISSAVEANYHNCSKFRNYFVCQADIQKLPVSPNQFDIVVCIGVIQHTPNPEKTIDALCSQVKPGGMLFIDHYTYGYPVTPTRKILRSLLTHVPPKNSMQFMQYSTSILWPLHSALNKRKNHRIMRKIRDAFLFFSPLVDYHDSYPQLNQEQLKSWAMLDTYDTLTDHYKHLRSSSEIQEQLKKCGLENIQIHLAGNGIEARANKPIK